MPGLAASPRLTSRTLNEFAPVDLLDDRDDVYLPTPAEIAAACQEIQSEWTETERARRARGQAGRDRGARISTRPAARFLFERRMKLIDDRAA